MSLTIPAALEVLSTAGTAVKELASWKAKTKGSVKSLVSELKDNLLYLDMVAEDGIPLDDVINKLSIAKFRSLDNDGFDFNKLQKKCIAKYPSLDETDLSPWQGKNTQALVESIYDKINEIVIKHPYVGKNEKYRWSVRVANIRKRIWLLLRHVRS